MKTKKSTLWLLALVLLFATAACNLTPGKPDASEPDADLPDASEPAENPPAVVESGSISVKVSLETGSDGTVDNPVFGLFDASGTVVFTTILDNPDDLQPGQTDVYEFTAPYPFCQIFGWQLTKPSTGGEDDPWISTRITIEVDGGTAWLDGAFADLGTITADGQRGGNWSGIEFYLEKCIN